jgi:SulP family sulfate permease
MLEWTRGYDRATLSSDLVAAVIVTVMLIPQSLAYAALAGLPAQVGLYASMAPLVLYAVFGSSRFLAVGPVAVVSLMTATAIGDLAQAGSQHYWMLAVTVAFLSGALLLVMGLLRLGFLANFLSHPVISGFMTASALLIAWGQLRVMLGVGPDGVHPLTAAIGVAMLAYLYWARRQLKAVLGRLGLAPRLADGLAKAAPVAGIAAAAVLTWAGQWQDAGVRIVGQVPAGLPPLTLPIWDAALWQTLALPTLLISIVGFVESVSVGQTLAAKRRQRVVPDQELVALGASNLGAAFTGGYPVTGGLSRSVVNFDAGAQTPAAGVFAAVAILLAALFLTPALFYVPQAVLSATIVVAVLSLVDLKILRRTWAYSRPDFTAVVVTLLTTLAAGAETGLIAGVLLSLVLYLYRTSRPHIAEVGLVPGTEHFRNVLRHAVQVSPHLVSLRVDESLYFANARVLEDRVNALVAERPHLRHVVLQCSAINDIDASALESLEAINERLGDAGIRLHLSEVKGPVMDRLKESDLLSTLSGQVYMSHFQAVADLAQDSDFLTHS